MFNRILQTLGLAKDPYTIAASTNLTSVDCYRIDHPYDSNRPKGQAAVCPICSTVNELYSNDPNGDYCNICEHFTTVQDGSMFFTRD